MYTRKYLYLASGALIVIALVVVGVVMVNGNNARDKASEASTAQANIKADNSSQPVKSSDVKTPTNNGDLSNTLNGDASSIDDDLKNNENSDYNDTNLSDSSLYN
ncbi:MAG: hypothetical protein JWP06_578 [Candidatus Saccharibacteria bacterium]|nr:hypothetical protein [Candidatus Saccharibacteria bacterium]